MSSAAVCANRKKPCVTPRPDVVHHEGGLVARVRKQRVVDVLAVEEIGDRQRDDGCQRRTPVDQRQQQHADREDPAHRHVEAVEKRRRPLEAVGIHQNVGSAHDREHRSEQRQRSPDPHDQRHLLGTAEAFCADPSRRGQTAAPASS